MPLEDTPHACFQPAEMKPCEGGDGGGGVGAGGDGSSGVMHVPDDESNVRPGYSTAQVEQEHSHPILAQLLPTQVYPQLPYPEHVPDPDAW